MNCRVLVTGARGFVGRRLVAALESNGHEVRTHCTSDGDITNGVVDHAGVNHVYHLAGRTSVPESWINPLEFYRVNVLGTLNVLDFCRRNGASITLVSSYVYGVPVMDPIPESHPLSAFNPYGHSKILAEQAGSYFAEAFGLRVSIVRPFNLYGPGQAAAFLIPSILSQALDPACREISVSDERPRRDYLYIDDFVTLLSRLTDGKTGVYNAGCGQSHSVREVLDLVNGLIPSPKPVTCSNQPRPQEVLNMRADISKAQAELGWRPVTGLRDGLERTMGFLVGQARNRGEPVTHEYGGLR